MLCRHTQICSPYNWHQQHVVIYSLTHTYAKEHIRVKYLTKIVQAIMNVMVSFPNQQQVEKYKEELFFFFRLVIVIWILFF